MAYSMTGFGRSTCQCEGRELTVEFKSVNHRFLDIGMRLPRSLTFLEEKIRSCLQENLNRGHIDVFINYHNGRQDAKTVEINYSLADVYYEVISHFKEAYPIKDDFTLSVLFKLPDVFEIREAEDDRKAIEQLCVEACNEAVIELKVMRDEEGKKLCKDLKARALWLKDVVTSLEKKAEQLPDEYKEKLQERIRELLEDQIEIDSNRLANEVAYFADRTSIVEEIVRLKSHIDQLDRLLELNEPIGRKLDFIVQEMNREINTIGSKTTDMTISNVVIECKSEIEKMREQIQNIE